MSRAEHSDDASGNDRWRAVSRSLDDTARFASRVASWLEPGDVVLLVGDLGAGKTAFTKAVARALSIDEPVTSPTFTILRSYDGVHPNGERLRLLHLDAYRLDGDDGLEGIGFFELLDDMEIPSVALIEWGDRVRHECAGALELHFAWEGDDERSIAIRCGSSFGLRLDALLRSLRTLPLDTAPTGNDGARLSEAAR